MQAIQAKENCLRTKVKHRYFQKEEMQTEDICVGKSPQTISSKNCLDSKNLCEAKKKIKTGLWTNESSPVGNPYFKKCKMLGGSPQIMSYLSQKSKWIRTSRCLFKDGSFVNLQQIK